MKRKLICGSAIGTVLFFIAYVIASYFNYASEVYVIGMLLCGIVSIIAGISKKYMVWNILISLCLFSLALWGFISGTRFVYKLGLILFVGLVIINVVLSIVWSGRQNKEKIVLDKTKKQCYDNDIKKISQ